MSRGILVAGIGNRTQQLFGGGVDVVERPTRLRVDELAGNQHPRFAANRGVRAGHDVPSLSQLMHPNRCIPTGASLLAPDEAGPVTEVASRG